MCTTGGTISIFSIKGGGLSKLYFWRQKFLPFLIAPNIHISLCNMHILTPKNVYFAIAIMASMLCSEWCIPSQGRYSKISTSSLPWSRSTFQIVSWTLCCYPSTYQEDLDRGLSWVPFLLLLSFPTAGAQFHHVWWQSHVPAPKVLHLVLYRIAR